MFQPALPAAISRARRSGFGSGATAGVTAPEVILNFDSEGGKTFEKITSENVGTQLAIFLDGRPISFPVIQEVIPGGQATITGRFEVTTEGARFGTQSQLRRAPVPIVLQSSSAVGPTLGTAAISAGVVAGAIGFSIVALFMIAWYRLPVSSVRSRSPEYLAFMLAVIKGYPVALTASGIAGLVISVGMAVDANIAYI